MKQSNVIKGTLAVVALVAALVVGVAVHMHSVGSPTAGHSTQNTAKTATETTAKTAESITADYPGYSSAEEGVKAAGLVVTGVPLDSRCVLSSCYRPVWREFSFRKSGRF